MAFSPFSLNFHIFVHISSNILFSSFFYLLCILFDFRFHFSITFRLISICVLFDFEKSTFLFINFFVKRQGLQVAWNKFFSLGGIIIIIIFRYFMGNPQFWIVCGQSSNSRYSVDNPTILHILQRI